MKHMLIVGGTGIIGSAVAREALANGYTVAATSKDKPELPKGCFDTVVDIYNYRLDHAKRTYGSLKGRCGHFFIISTTLVYDRSGFSYQRIKSNHPLAKEGTQGSYVDSKLDIEKFWSGVTDANWTILRPYHVLGAGSYLGCIPPHNRNPDLLGEIKKGQIILYDGGRIPLNIVHPKDIGKIILVSAGNSKTFSKKYNTVNPVEIIARDYYLEIARQLGINLKIDNLQGEVVWDNGKWTLTTLPHLYDTSDLEEDIGYIPETGLEECIKGALANRPEQTNVSERMNAGHVKRNRYF